MVHQATLRKLSAVGCCAAIVIACGSRESRTITTDAGPTTDRVDANSADAGPLFRIQFIDPDFGPFSGGTEVTIRGNGFTADSVVTFGGRQVEPLDFEFIDSRRLVVLSPPGDPGSADIEVTTQDGTATLPDGFSYEAVTISPDSGSVAGGTFVTITGLGTSFDEDTQVALDGVPLTNVTIVNTSVITGKTPAGIAGTADLSVRTQTNIVEARRAYTYQATADPFFGGMGGGPIDGTLNVVVINDDTGDGVDGAFVVIGDAATSPHQGTADDLGQITFSGPELEGPITVTAAAEGYEMASMVTFDAQDVTIFLRQIPIPTPGGGPFPPGRQIGRVYGHILFGDATGVGSPAWNLVPAPRTSTEIKRVYVTTTAPNVFANPYAPVQPIDYAGFDPDQVAWAYEVRARPSAVAIVAIAGLYDPAKDPTGFGVTGFQPFAMGIKRGVLVGPAEVVENVDVVINIPLDGIVQVNLAEPPRLSTPGERGPEYYSVKPFIDLGGEGVISLNKNGLSRPPLPEVAPNEYLFAPGQTAMLLTNMPPLAGDLGDASYTFQVGAWSGDRSNPYSVRVAQGYRDVSLPVEVGDFLGTPRLVDPRPNGQASGPSFRFEAEGPASGEATFHYHRFDGLDGRPVYTAITRGDVFEVELPKLGTRGFPGIPAGENIQWTLFRIRVPGVTFDDFRYSYLSSLFWGAYAADAFLVRFPAN